MSTPLLLVDDDRGFAGLAAALLTQEGFAVTLARSLHEARAACERTWRAQTKHTGKHKAFIAACVAKGGACWGAARLSGAPPRHALAIGTLMNARGMVELILANIGLQRGVITPTLFVILVLMAIGTTVMTGPLFSLVWEESGSYPVFDRLSAKEGYDSFS